MSSGKSLRTTFLQNTGLPERLCYCLLEKKRRSRKKKEDKKSTRKKNTFFSVSIEIFYIELDLF